MPDTSEPTIPRYNIRNFRPADFNFLALLFAEAEAREPVGRPATPQAFAERLSRPGYAPERDLVVVETDGEVIGFVDMTPEPSIGRVVADPWLKPEHRRRGLGRRLLDSACEHARGLGVQNIHTIIRNDNVPGKTVLNRLGFRFVRRFLEIHLELDKIDRREMERTSAGCRTLHEGEEEELARLQNQSFADHWGYNPNTAVSIAFRLGLSHRSPKDVIFACEDNEVTGYCWTEVTGKGQGRIYMIGSDPAHRRRGVGRRLLMAGLNHLRKKGIEDVRLTVDSENKTACALYESLGFEERTTYLWYEKKVD